MSADIFDPTFDDEPTAFDDDQYCAPWPPMVRDDPDEESAVSTGRPGSPTRSEPEAPECDEPWGADIGATTAEYAITTLAACGFAALLVVVLKSEPIRDLVTGVIQTALGLGS